MMYELIILYKFESIDAILFAVQGSDTTVMP
jgi:hypothetical protein